MRWSVHAGRRPGFPPVVNCQSDLLSSLPTRLVIPLERVEAVQRPIKKLNPRVEVRGEAFYVMTDLIAAVPATSLGEVVGDLGAHDHTITSAIDMLLSGV